mgnify:FL=1
MSDVKLPSIDDFIDGELSELESLVNEEITQEEREEEERAIREEIERILAWEPPEPKSTEYMIENEFITTGWVGFFHLDRILTDAIVMGASDVHITANQVVSMSINGDIVRNTEYMIPDREIMDQIVTNGILSNQQQQILNRDLEYDGSYELMHGPLKGRRTRINVGLSFSNYFIVFRIINDYIPSIEEIGLEDEILEWAEYPSGLFMLCGPTGTGKSTSLAAIIQNIQQTKSKKIITIENPIEYIYSDDEPSLVVQREVGGDTRGFYEGLTSAMRQNPDVILLGEVRNTEEVTELLRAAETGHLAISTMHTNSVPTTINRIQNLFEGNEQRRIMSTLADTLRGLGNQVLVKTPDNNGRFAVRELLTINSEIKDYILKGDIRAIRNYQERHGLTMEHGLAKAVREGKCTRDEAFRHTVYPDYLRELLDS